MYRSLLLAGFSFLKYSDIYIRFLLFLLWPFDRNICFMMCHISLSRLIYALFGELVAIFAHLF